MSKLCTHSHSFWLGIVRTCPYCLATYSADGRRITPGPKRPEPRPIDEGPGPHGIFTMEERMMSANDVKYAADLCDAYTGLDDVRTGLKEKVTYGKMFIELSAYEHEGDAGGVGHGNALIPARLAAKIIEAVEMIIGDELARHGVDPPLKKAKP